MKEKYEIHHGISISDNAVIAASKLSARYITNRKLPDKAIDLIDEAASKKRIELKTKPLQAEKLENILLKNKIELENILKENKTDNKRKNELEKENLKIHTSLKKLLNEWYLYKNEIEKLNKLKEELEKNNGELKKAKRNGDLALAGKLTHYELPRLKEQTFMVHMVDILELNTTHNIKLHMHIFQNLLEVLKETAKLNKVR